MKWRERGTNGRQRGMNTIGCGTNGRGWGTVRLPVTKKTPSH
ncbi:hypothetical protein J2Z83_000416 [Virgibacillus natechei]|uniref:Uncharacterized protein n=1 Tax=Virgibacillus natechei TaxID=1216297 RepID=A0ABS4IBL2_9BACI|nr:hypothetical protein [Virgibacillus natechei]